MFLYLILRVYVAWFIYRENKIIKNKKNLAQR